MTRHHTHQPNPFHLVHTLSHAHNPLQHAPSLSAAGVLPGRREGRPGSFRASLSDDSPIQGEPKPTCIQREESGSSCIEEGKTAASLLLYLVCV